MRKSSDGRETAKKRARTQDVAIEDIPAPPRNSKGSGLNLGSPPAPSSAGRSLGKARRPYSDLLGCLPQLYNLLPQPGGRGRWAD